MFKFNHVKLTSAVKVFYFSRIKCIITLILYPGAISLTFDIDLHLLIELLQMCMFSTMRFLW